MEIVLTRQTLLNVAGIALITAITLQLLVKPWLSKYYAERAWHDIALNAIATVFAVILAIVGRYVAVLVYDGPSTAFAVVQGIVGAFLAVYGYEAAKNIQKYVNFIGGDKIEGDKIEGGAAQIGDVHGDVTIN